ncbi:hypothetical protein LTS16_012754 [Friedmanniomyces endolithicus]|nr:hypothetical protein LTR03_003439 [Friedmanniomyces endolithicus]KAK1037533.1 hypothetical protein LTS16_012754 [Friedmanniomyces endolithicus]
MDYQDSHKRFKRADGSPVAVTNAAANLPAYQPPPPLPIAANGPGGFSNGSLDACEKCIETMRWAEEGTSWQGTQICNPQSNIP